MKTGDYELLTQLAGRRAKTVGLQACHRLGQHHVKFAILQASLRVTVNTMTYDQQGFCNRDPGEMVLRSLFDARWPDHDADDLRHDFGSELNFKFRQENDAK